MRETLYVLASWSRRKSPTLCRGSIARLVFVCVCVCVCVYVLSGWVTMMLRALRCVSLSFLCVFVSVRECSCMCVHLPLNKVCGGKCIYVSLPL
jgi:hypothetical protein